MRRSLQLWERTVLPQLPAQGAYPSWQVKYAPIREILERDRERFISQQTQIKQEKMQRERLQKRYRIAVIGLSGILGATSVIASLALIQLNDMKSGGS